MLKKNLPPGHVENLEELTRNMLKLLEDGARAMSTLVARSDGRLSPYSAASEIVDAAATAAEIGALWTVDPLKLAQAQGALVRSYAELWSNSVPAPDGRGRGAGRRAGAGRQPLQGSGVVGRTPTSTSGSRPISSPRSWAEDMLQKTEGLDERTRQKAEFYLRQVSSALSPSNFPMTNPEVRARDACHERPEPRAGHDATSPRT